MIPDRDIKQFVHSLAAEHGVAYHKTGLDLWAEAVTGLSGDAVVLDGTEALILELARKHVISSDDAIRLQVLYLRECNA